jgi:hypothetical protein
MYGDVTGVQTCALPICLEEVKALFPQIAYTDEITKQRNLVKYILGGITTYRHSAERGELVSAYTLPATVLPCLQPVH